MELEIIFNENTLTIILSVITAIASFITAVGTVMVACHFTFKKTIKVPRKRVGSIDSIWKLERILQEEYRAFTNNLEKLSKYYSENRPEQFANPNDIKLIEGFFMESPGHVWLPSDVSEGKKKFIDFFNSLTDNGRKQIRKDLKRFNIYYKD